MNHEPIASLHEPETWLDRLKVEHKELTDKLNKLSSFLGSEASLKLHACDYADLRHQKFVMTEYAYILEKRIQRGEK